MTEDLTPLIEHLRTTTSLGRDEAQRVVLDVIAYLSESAEDYVMRRHRELKLDEGLRNEAIFERLADELSRRVFSVGRLSARQIRRMIYG